MRRQQPCVLEAATLCVLEAATLCVGGDNPVCLGAARAACDGRRRGQRQRGWRAAARGAGCEGGATAAAAAIGAARCAHSRYRFSYRPHRPRLMAAVLPPPYTAASADERAPGAHQRHLQPAAHRRAARALGCRQRPLAPWGQHVGEWPCRQLGSLTCLGRGSPRVGRLHAHARGEPGPVAPHRGAVVPPAVHANARQRLRCSRHPLSPQARSKRRPPRRCCRSSLPHCPPSRAGSAQRKTPPRWVGVGSAGGSALQPRCSSKGIACNRSGLRRYDPAALPMRTILQQRKPATLRTRARGPTPPACSAKVSQLLPCCGGSAAGCKSAVLAAP